MTPEQDAGAMNATGATGAAAKSTKAWNTKPPVAPEAIAGVRDPMGEIAGAQQGPAGIAQGATGAMYGGMTGTYDGINRAASGGMNGGPYAEILAKIIPSLGELLAAQSGIGKFPASYNAGGAVKRP